MQSTGLGDARTHPVVDGVEVLDTVGVGANSVVYRARRDGRTLALKIWRQDSLQRRDRAIALFRREAAALARVRHEGVIGVVATGTDAQGAPYLLLEHVDGESLAARLGRGPLSEAEAAGLLEAIAQALDAIHRAGLVHRDIKPANVVLDDAGQPHIVDFGLALGALDAAARIDLAGTYVYASPEQAGALKLSVDGRSDLYSLGVLAYECLVGEPPFAARDQATLVRMHASVVPKRVRDARAEISETMSAIVAKLLAKDPDDRYQTAASLAADLRRVTSLGAAALGRRARDPRLPHRNQLVGRETEIGRLERLLLRAHAGRGGAALVRSERGAGSSHLGFHLAERCEADEARWAWASGSGSGDGPLAAVRAWVNALVQSPDPLDAAQLARELDASAPLVWELFPSLRSLLDAPDEAALANANQDVFLDAAAALFLAIAKQRGPLLLVLDDAESADDASANVVRQLARRATSAPVLLLCIEHTGSASRFADDLAPHLDLELELAQLDHDALASLVRQFLGSDRVPDEVVHELTMRAQGNARALFEYLRTLLDAGGLHLERGQWRIDRQALTELALPEDIGELSLARAATLPTEERVVLATAAVCGARFDVATVAAVSELDLEQVASSVEHALAERLIQHLADGVYAFVDPRVRDRLALGLDAERRAHVHRELARRLEREAKGDEPMLHAIAHHHAEGVCEESAARAYEANLEAGKLALERLSRREALELLEQARDIRQRFGLPEQRSLYEALADGYAHAGKVDQAFADYARAVALAEDELTRAELNLRVAELHMHVNFNVQDMEKHLEQSWSALGERMPANEPKLALGFFFYGLLTLFMDLTGIGIGGAVDVRRAKLEYRLIENTLKWAYFRNLAFVLIGFSFRATYAGLRVGPSREMVSALATHSSTLVTLGFPMSLRDRYLDKARNMAKQVRDTAALVRAEYWGCVGLFQVGRTSEGCRRLNALLRDEGKWLDINDLMFAYIDLSVAYQNRGYNVQSVEVIQRCLEEIVARAGFHANAAEMCRELLVGNKSIFSRPHECAAFYQEKLKDVRDPKAQNFLWFQSWTNQVGLRLESRDWDSLDEAIDQLARAERKPEFAGWQFQYAWVILARARLGQCWEASAANRPRRIEQLRVAVEALKVPSKLGFYRAMSLVFQSALEFFDGQVDRAFETMGRAHTEAARHDCPLAAFWGFEQRARMLTALGQPESAKRDLSLALAVCEERGWPHRARVLKQDLAFGIKGTTLGTTARTGTSASPSTGNRIDVVDNAELAQVRRDRDALLEVSMAVSDGLDARKQADVALDKLLEILGGEHALLCVHHEETNGFETISERNARREHTSGEAPLPRSVLERTCERRDALVVNGMPDAERLGVTDVVEGGARSVISAPVALRNRVLGVVYLESRVAKGVFTEADVDIVKAICTQLAVSWETIRLTQAEIERRALEKDLQLSAAVQALLMPKQDVLEHDGISVAGFFEPAQQVSGDFWYADRTRDGKLRVILGDVTGHGAGSAMVTAILATCYRALRECSDVDGTAALLARTHRTLREICGGSYTAPLSALEVDPSTGLADLWSAAGTPLVVRGTDGSTRTVTARGMPLGAEDLSLGHERFELACGERALLFSDGLSELRLENGRELGLRRICRMMARTPDPAVVSMRDHMVGAVRAHCAGQPHDDDVTFVVVGRR